MEIPVKDTPARQLLARGMGGKDADTAAVADCMQLLRVSKLLLKFFYEQFTAQGISPGKYSVLCELLAAGQPLAPSALAGRIGVRRPTITGLLDGLEKQGWVARVADENDRRRQQIKLTASGERFLHKLLPQQYRLMASVITQLDNTERSRLRRILDKMETSLA